MVGKSPKRTDSKRVVLRTGEYQRKDGIYSYRWTDKLGKRHSIYAKTLDLLREKEKEIQKDKLDGIKTESRYITLDELYELWKQLKRGLKNNTFENYKYMYNTFVKSYLGDKKISTLKKSDVKRFYNYLADERGLKSSTIDSIHTVLHQILDIAVDDNFIRNNPTNNVLKELKKSHVFKEEKRRALTKAQQDLLLNFLKRSHTYSHWYPLFAVMIGTGLRVGEITGLRWNDIDIDKSIIDINHTLVYYNHREENGKNGCYFNINTPKTKNSNRKVPMLDFVRDAFIQEYENQKLQGIKCNVIIDGYSNFIFINRFGATQHQGTINKAIKRIIRDCNDEEFMKSERPKVLLPNFSCHTLRHTFTTRMCEAGINTKVIQDILGHKDITTTLNIYADVTKDMKNDGVVKLQEYLRQAL